MLEFVKSCSADTDSFAKCCIIWDGNRNSERYYLDFKKPLTDIANRATVGTLYGIASDNGYKFKPKEQPEPLRISELENADEPIMIERYIGKRQYLKLLKNEKQIGICFNSQLTKKGLLNN